MRFLRAHRGNRMHFDRLRKLVAVENQFSLHAPNVHTMSGAEPSERNFGRLNRNFSNILYDGDIIISEKRLRELVDDIGSQQSGRKARSKRWAYRDKFYPDTIWRTGIPYAFDVDLREYRNPIPLFQ
ncbi:unnamed protein product [Cylicostephanus goldi]|uniref:Uncharacterized protein n=1 Tax=Cylicostephanus goldi TaxID=71465 RepID=A0A3P7P4U0_CYLGO|nr:unnamed protein product [Cylicostephanus goldi]